MTIRSAEDYTCTGCDNEYLPFKEGMSCPICAEPSQRTSGIVDEFLQVINFYYGFKRRITEFGGVPGPLLMQSTGDKYLRIGTEVLATYPKGTPLEEMDLPSFAHDCIERLTGDGPMQKHLEEYVLTIFERITEIMRGAPSPTSDQKSISGLNAKLLAE